MPVTLNSRLGLHEILAPLGAGGMGEVYRGRDTRLDRGVAGVGALVKVHIAHDARVRDSKE